MAKLKASIVICTYDRYDVLPKAINSCLEQSLPTDSFEIIIVDNSPDHVAAREFAGAYMGAENLAYLVEEKPGLSNARNIGARTSKADIVAYLDDDAIAAPDWLEALIRAYDAHGSKAVAAGGQVLPLWDAPRPAWLHDEKLGYVSVVDWGGSTRYLGQGEWIAGANISFRRKALLSIGAFDTSLGRNGTERSLLSNEESDVLKRLAATGGRVLYVPDATVRHLVDQRRLKQDWFRRRSAWQAVSDYIENGDAPDWADGAFDSALDFLHRQPPRYRRIAGLGREMEQADEFNDQLDAIYNLTLATLSGLKSVP